MAETLRETLSVKRIGENAFEAQPFHEQARMGNAAPIAFGGLVLSQAITAGHHTLPSSPTYHIYSCNGTYLGPASTEVPTRFQVQDIRTTRSFCTRLVIATQTPPPARGGSKGEERRVLVVLLDYHITEPSSMMTYSNPPMYPFVEAYGRPDQMSQQKDLAMEMLPPEVAKAYTKSFNMALRFFDWKSCPHSLAVRNFMGMRPELAPRPSGSAVPDEAQAELTRRTNAYWIKAKEHLQGEIEHTAGVGFVTDMILSFLPLVLTHRPLTAASAASSLDFSLRFFRPIDLTQWHLHEQHTEHGAEGKTFSIGRLYNPEGVEVAHMSQMSILRDLKKKDATAKAKL